LTDFLRRLFQGVLNTIANFLNSMGVRPNTVTMFGLLGNLAAGYLITTGRLKMGGLCVLIISPLDAVDGALARLSEEKNRFGAFLDSVVDRYSELALFFGLLIYAIRTESDILLMWSFVAAAGSVMVSYTRARAEALGADSEVGILTRVERYLVIVLALLFNQPLIGMIIIGVLANVTAIQRIIHVHSQMKG